jgi:putative copper export protein/mono/diheme cytochrome c family protein
MTALLVVRALNLACGALLLGIPAVLAVALLPPLLGREEMAAARLRSLLGPLLRLLWVSAAVGLVSGVLWLLLQAAEMSGRTLGDAASAEIIGPALWRTQFGHVMLVRLVLALALAGCLAALRPRQPLRVRIRLLQAASIPGALGFVALAWAGHAAASAEVVHLVADAAHLLAAGIWLGGLAGLAALLATAGARPEPAWLGVIAQATRRFSLLGTASVATLLVSGIVNSWFLVGTVPALLGTAYGYLLLIKIALFGLMVGLAAVNRFRLTPLIGGRGGQGRADSSASAIRRLRRNTLAEAALGVLVLVIVSALGTVPPGIHDQPWWPFPYRMTTEVVDALELRGEIATAALAAGAGIALCLVGALWRRHRWPAILVGLGLVVWFSPSFGVLLVDAYPTTFYRSPVPYTTTSLVRGNRLYEEHCTQCHGARGKGDGEAAGRLRVPPANLTDPHVLDHAEGDIFWWLTAGIPESSMPGYARELSEDERWDVVNWVRTMPLDGLANGLTPQVAATAAVRAPDFAIETADGQEDAAGSRAASGVRLLVLFTSPGSQARLAQLDAARATLAEAGLEIVALPIAGTSDATPPSFVARADPSVAQCYRLIATLRRDRDSPLPTHLELLIDGGGYLRAQWQPGTPGGWDDLATLLLEVRRLAGRPFAPPTAHVHVH